MAFTGSKTVQSLYYLLIYLFASLTCVYAQPPLTQYKRNTLFLEASSKGPLYSLNYDRIVKVKDNLTYSYRTGFTVEREGIGASFGINMLTGQSRHHAELSLAAMPYIDHYKSFLSKEDISDKYLYIIPSIGYRYQQWKGGFFFRVAAAPFVFLDPPSDHFWHMAPKVYPSLQTAVGISF